MSPLVTLAVPSFNQGEFLEEALTSIFDQDVPVEVFVADAGSTDGTVGIIRKFEHRLAGWRSHPDQGQSAAINESVARGKAPYVAWLNSDDLLLLAGLRHLTEALDRSSAAAAAYGKVWNLVQRTGKKKPVWVEPFDERRLALRCIISQPGALVRRSAWEAVNGLDERLQMAIDYDLWWRLYRKFGRLEFVDHFVAINRDHVGSKTNTQRKLHYAEATRVVRKHYGCVPLKWCLAQPYAVLIKSLANRFNALR